MALTREEVELNRSVLELCARVGSAQGYELQNAIIELSKALETWRGAGNKSGNFAPAQP